MKGIIRTVMIIVLFILFMGDSSGAFAADKFKDEFEKEKEAVALLRNTQLGGYNIVTTEEMKQMLDTRKDILVVDTMPHEDSFKKEHVPGAVNFLFPVPIMNEWDPKETGGKTPNDFSAFLGPDKDKIIIFYCGFVKCNRSHNGAVWAKKLGYKNVYRHPGGIFAWKGAKYKTESTK